MFSERASRGLQITAVTCGKVDSMSRNRMFLKAFNQVNYAPAIRFPFVSVLSFPRVSIPKSS